MNALLPSVTLTPFPRFSLLGRAEKPSPSFPSGPIGRQISAERIQISSATLTSKSRLDSLSLFRREGNETGSALKEESEEIDQQVADHAINMKSSPIAA